MIQILNSTGKTSNNITKASHLQKQSNESLIDVTTYQVME